MVGDLRQRVAELEDELARTRHRLAQLEAAGFPRRDLVPTNQHQTALVVWRPTKNV
jgi:MerR family transcriptional regulator, heat shock protein HspR